MTTFKTSFTDFTFRTSFTIVLWELGTIEVEEHKYQHQLRAKDTGHGIAT